MAWNQSKSKTLTSEKNTKKKTPRHVQVPGWLAAFAETNVVCFPVKTPFDFFQNLVKDGRSPPSSALALASAMVPRRSGGGLP
jgi:hypothetical protein